MNRSNARETFFTGAWLAATQVSLGFSLMLGAGAAAILFFLFLFFWLAGSASGILWWRLHPLRTTAPLFCAVMTVNLSALLLLNSQPFQDWSCFAGMAASYLSGLFASTFFCHRTTHWNEVRLVLLYENNGFVCGYIAAATMLLFSARLVYILTFALAGLAFFCSGTGLIPSRLTGKRSPG